MNIDIPEESWEDISPDTSLPRSRLLTTVQLCGGNHHLEAIQVHQPNDSKFTQEAVCPICDDILIKYHDAAEGDGPFSTVKIGEHSYVLMLTPYCT